MDSHVGAQPVRDPLPVGRSPTTTPMARMSAVVSVMITSITMIIETMAATWKVGIPKWNGVETATTGPCTHGGEVGHAQDRRDHGAGDEASRIDSREMVALPSLREDEHEHEGEGGEPDVLGGPEVSADGLPPMAHIAATGSSEIPMTVITEPVTTGGKNRMMLANRARSRSRSARPR